MDTARRSELERLSKENFDLKLRLHYYEEEQGQPTPTHNEQQEESYRQLVEEAKTVIAELQDSLNQTKEDLIQTTHELEDTLLENEKLKIKSEKPREDEDEHQKRQELSAKRIQTLENEIASLKKAHQERITLMEQQHERAILRLNKQLESAESLASESHKQVSLISHSDTKLAKQLQEAESTIFDLNQKLSSRLPAHNQVDDYELRIQKLTKRAQESDLQVSELKSQLSKLSLTSKSSPTAAVNPEWEELSLRFAGTTNVNDFLAYLHTLQTKVRDWEHMAEELTHRKHSTPLLVQEMFLKKLPPTKRVQLAEDLLKDATERLERLETSRGKFRWEDAITRVHTLERENQHLREELKHLLPSRRTSTGGGGGGRRFQRSIELSE